MKKILFLITAILTTFISCRKDLTETIVTIDENPPVVLIETAIRGKVVDEEGSPLIGARVSVGNQNLQTDESGCFHFKNVSVKKSGTIVKATETGFYNGSAHSNFTAEGSSYVEVRMIKKGAPQTIEGILGGEITSNGGMKINIPPNALISQNGDPYYDEVQVFSRWLDPTDSEVGGIMPGALMATDEDGNPLALATYGMMAMELEASNGSVLKVKPGETIKVEMPIPPSLATTAPEEIPLWYFDLDEEQWLLSGSCKKIGNYYECKITSTGYWNCDIALPAICLSGQVFNSDSSFGCYLKVIVEDLTDNFIYWGHTDSTGYFCGSVPQAAPLRIYIKDHCDSIIYTADIGPFSDDFELDDIYLNTIVSEYLINITGSVLHCVTTDIPSGHVAIRYPDKIRIHPIVAGGFDINLGLKCVEFPNLYIRSYSAFQPNATIEINHADFSDIDLGLLNTCEALPDYFNLTADGTDYWTSPTQFYFKNNSTTDWLILEGLSGGGKFVLEVRDYQGIGTYSTNVFFNTDNNPNVPTYPILTTSSPDLILEITSDNGDFIEGTLAGTAIDNFGISINISGDFKIRKAP